jgi:hypothetical protein
MPPFGSKTCLLGLSSKDSLLSHYLCKSGLSISMPTPGGTREDGFCVIHFLSFKIRMNAFPVLHECVPVIPVTQTTH